MKSYFSRFLHHTSSYSGIREVFTSSLSLSDLIGESRSNKVANLSHLDYRVKPDNDNIGVDYRVKPDNDSLCAGRSMVEMLGVLAIVGVLSVGAITGYSKAMFKYKLNKHAEQMNTVINAVARNAHSFGNLGAATTLTPIFIKMGEIPVEMIKAGDTNNIYDIFGQAWYIVINSYNTMIFLHSRDNPSLRSSSRDNLAICQSFFTTAKENANNLYYITAISNYDNENKISNPYYGDAYCNNKSNKCLRNLTLDDIYAACTAHKNVNQPIYFQITWSK